LAMDGVKLSFTPDALDYIVEKAIEFKVGARGLRSLVETIMMDYMFHVPTEQVTTLVITRELAQAQIDKADRLKLQNAV